MQEWLSKEAMVTLLPLLIVELSKSPTLFLIPTPLSDRINAPQHAQRQIHNSPGQPTATWHAPRTTSPRLLLPSAPPSRLMLPHVTTTSIAIF